MRSSVWSCSAPAICFACCFCFSRTSFTRSRVVILCCAIFCSNVSAVSFLAAADAFLSDAAALPAAACARAGAAPAFAGRKSVAAPLARSSTAWLPAPAAACLAARRCLLAAYFARAESRMLFARSSPSAPAPNINFVLLSASGAAPPALYPRIMPPTAHTTAAAPHSATSSVCREATCRRPAPAPPAPSNISGV